MTGWNGSYYLWHCSRGFRRVVSNFHWGGYDGGGGEGMGKEIDMMTSRCKDEPDGNVGKGCVIPLI